MTNPQDLITPTAIRDYMRAVRETVHRHPEIAEMEPNFADPPAYAEGEMLKLYVDSFSHGRFGNYGIKTAVEMDNELQKESAAPPPVLVIHPTPQNEFAMLVSGLDQRMVRGWDRDVMIQYRRKSPK